MATVSFIPDQPAARVHASLRCSLEALDQARQSAVLWFSDVMKRELYRELGYSSIYQYATDGLGFSKSRTRDFVRLAGQLGNLPNVRQAMSKGELGYTKAREIVGVATPETETKWLEAAKAPRTELVRQVKRAREAAKVDPAQTEFVPFQPTVVAPAEMPVRFQIDLTPEQEARRAALVERLHKLGGATTDRAELMLEALAALVETREKGPRGPHGSQNEGPPVHIHVHEEKGLIMAGNRAVGRADAARMRCDAVICKSGERNRATIAPRIRREVLSRDRHRCRAPGCERIQFLEVHHVVPRTQGGSNQPDNLMTLCGSCHRLWHERAG